MILDLIDYNEYEEQKLNEEVIKPTDFYNYLGGYTRQVYLSNIGSCYYVDQKNDSKYKFYIVSRNIFDKPDIRETMIYDNINVGIKPIARISLDMVKKFFKDYQEILNTDEISYFDKIEINLGEYPQTEVKDVNLETELEMLYKKNKLKETGKIYKYRLREPNNYFKEYEYNNNKYIRMVIKVAPEEEYTSTNTYLHEGATIWMEVEPVTWRLIKKDNKYSLISKNVLLAGQSIDENEQNGIEISISKNPEIYFFLDELAKEIFNEKGNEKEDEKKEKKEENNKKETIKNAIKEGKAVFLHGREVDGKFELINELYQNSETLCLKNSNLGKLIGISTYSSKRGKKIDVKPSWLKRIEMQSEINPNKIFIICFDQILESDEVIKEKVLEIIKQRKVNGKWDLPENMGIVLSDEKIVINAEGVDKEILDNCININVNPKMKDWIKWAQENQRIKLEGSRDSREEL